MSEERLEEHTHIAVKKDEYKKLKEQAERVQKLEEIKSDAIKQIDLTQERNKRLEERVQELEEVKEALGDLIEKTAIIAWKIEQQNKRYREALKFYADEENYKPFDGIFLSSYQNKVDEDGGEVAQKALEESE